MFSEFLPSLRLTLVTFVVCGLAYPLGVTALAQGLFPAQANGSLILRGGHPVGSRLVGQKFEGPRWFHGRVSSIDYKAESSGSSNYGPTSQALLDRVATDVAAFKAANPEAREIPADLLTQSGSGLDPHITPAAALAQAPRVAKARGLSVMEVTKLIQAHTEGRDLGLFGEPRVNVLELNLALH
ncbi:MAG: kdpC [Cyanobacteria bacterium RYN_339]|nr:kdpC [Cyanobacteria bacterium RYN_339]